MKLSFVIPAYNEEASIGKCLKSVLRELKDKNYDVEIIVVNNASTDKTGEVAASFPGVIVVHEPMKGIVHARQTGFRVAKGELIANIDSDTMLTPGWIEKVFDEFSKNRKLVALSGPFIYYDVPFMVRAGAFLFYCIGFVGYILNRFVFRVGSMLQGGNFVLRKAALEKAGGYDVNLKFYGEDTDIARRLYPFGDVKFTFKLPMYASGRRLMEEGPFTMAGRYAINYFWTTFFKRPFTNKYIDIRSSDNGKGTVLKYHPLNRKKELALATFTIFSMIIIVGGVALFMVSMFTGISTPKQVALSAYYKITNEDKVHALYNKFINLKAKIGR